MTSKEETMELTEQELFDTEDLIRTVHKYELLDDRDGGIEAVTKFRKATEAKVREEYAGLVRRANENCDRLAFRFEDLSKDLGRYSALSAVKAEMLRQIASARNEVSDIAKATLEGKVSQ
jgi:hypothetical protein